MHTFSASELRGLIGQMKNRELQEPSTEKRLLEYGETEEGIEMIFYAIQVEDSIGRFFCLLVLQKAIRSLMGKGEGPLDRMISGIENIVEKRRDSTERMEVKRLSALYSTLALLLWPVKMERFIEKLSGLLQEKKVLGIEILKNFLSQSTDSLEITEERRYELRKSLSLISYELFVLAVKGYDVKEVVNVLTSMCRLNIASPDALIMLFRSSPEFVEEISELIGEISTESKGELFEVLSQYLYETYIRMREKQQETVQEVIECAVSFGNQAIPKVMNNGMYDQVLREILRDSVHGLKDLIDGDAILGSLKIFTSRAKGFLIQKNGNISPREHAETEEEIQVVLGKSPVEMLLSLCNLHEATGSVSNDAIIRTLDLIADTFPCLITEFLSRFHESIPVHASEAFLKKSLVSIPFTTSYLLLKQSVIRKEYDPEIIKRADLRTGKECAVMKECLEAMDKSGLLDPNLVLFVYERAIEISGYYSLDLAVTCGVLLKRKDLILHTMQGFEGKGVAAFVSAVNKCPEVIQEIFPHFQEYFLKKEGDITNEVDAITKVLMQSSKPVGKVSGTGISVQCKGIDALEIFGVPVLEKIYSKIEHGSFFEIKKITKMLPYLLGKPHTSFIWKLWERMKREIDLQMESGDYKEDGNIHSVISNISSECTAEETEILYEIVQSGEYTTKGVFIGIKAILEHCKGMEKEADIERACVIMLLSIYGKYTEESIRAVVVGVLSETPQRISIIEQIYGVSLSDVHAEKEKRPAMKRALRRLEGTKEKQGALFRKEQKPKAQQEDRWSDIVTPFN
ncbi:hypothetical protein NEFER03_0220 [Nematocida sp. LUAm3]|nr:hypothetical protein NEFER03_0220 [Nematocida sp. LUAm3]KAI5173673.1 hypothetical protein NEFER02_0189 [Nematocida sp. LUAm2]KAI5176894.1 hypothetical protein NEFER01_0219 [Nematocida sp. LUAm1]